MSYSSSYTETESTTFTVTHARHIAVKVATDLKRFQRYYDGRPSEAHIDQLEQELIYLLKHDVVSTVTYGFRRNGKWVEAIMFRALPGGTVVNDDDPGRLRPTDVSGTDFYSFLEYNSKWLSIDVARRVEIQKNSPVQRSNGEQPALEVGRWKDDLNYYSGGRGLGRSTITR